jgi:hypothetical protein
MRIFEHEAAMFIGNGIEFGVGNAGIRVSHYYVFLCDIYVSDYELNALKKSILFYCKNTIIK